MSTKQFMDFYETCSREQKLTLSREINEQITRLPRGDLKHRREMINTQNQEVYINVIINAIRHVLVLRGRQS
ncbi:hypothetical protein ACFL2D_01430 [Patescibacteria group bacterium]